ncbi:hypothetical protein [Paraburkholderia sp. SIMBA_054]|uniref:hypothetical protein n=1 Tax=Paraburkholderia sp. SIMBA_054 TaxID=3085795 RepID=UPI00397C4E64
MFVIVFDEHGGFFDRVQDAHQRLFFGTAALAVIAVLVCCLMMYTVFKAPNELAPGRPDLSPDSMLVQRCRVATVSSLQPAETAELRSVAAGQNFVGRRGTQCMHKLLN